MDPVPSTMRVMLIEPPFYRLYHDNYSLVKYPLALGYLSGAVLEWTDWTVQTKRMPYGFYSQIERSSRPRRGKALNWCSPAAVR